MNRNIPLKLSVVAGCSYLMTASTVLNAEKKTDKLNILLFTADDLGYESVGCMNPDSGLPDLTPNLDRFASEGLQFNYAHTNTPICQPSRAVIATGRFGVTSGMMGFIHMKKKVPTIMQYLRDNGYITGILGKVSHSTPNMQYKWDFMHDYGDLGAGRSPLKYYNYCKEFFKLAKKEGKPFYFMVNSHDPHRGFHNPDKPMRNAETPSKLFTPSEVIVPPFLPDLPGVRKEMSHYYNSVRRLDDTFGKVIQALKESGMEKSTLIMFLSDNGSAFPFAKANVYCASTRTPWFVHYPGVVKPGTVDNTHLISEVDYFPTVLDAAKIPIPEGVDGRSFLPLLKGEKQNGREVVYKEIDYLIGGPARPMRAVEDKRFVYIFSPWSKKDAHYRNANEGDTMKAMEEAAKTDPAVAERVRVFRDRDVEEFYDLEKDPGCVNNLISNPEYAEKIKELRDKMKVWMGEKNDPVLKMMNHRTSEDSLQNDIAAFPTKNSLMPDDQIKHIKEKQAAKRKHKKKKNRNQK